MDNIVVDFIRAKRIDSFQKLYVLLFLHQHPTLVGTSQQFANKLYLGHLPLVKEILDDLHRVGLVDGIGRRYKLCNDSEVGAYLQFLAEALKDPLARQKILEQVRGGNISMNGAEGKPTSAI